MTTGSHNQQIYWYATGNSRVLGQLPAIWLTADRRWIPRRAAVMRPPGPPHPETGAWNAICVACHTTDGRPRLDAPFGSRPIGDQIADTTSAEFGIACEACHGPGGDHVRANRRPQRRYWLHLTGGPDPTIARPDRLDPRRSSQVCGQCHSFWEFTDAASERRANTSGLPYRPGDDLAATRLIVQPTVNLESAAMQALAADDPGFVRDTFWSDGMVRATGREYNGLIDSPCFKRTTDPKRTLSCFSCHTMHKSPDDTRSLDEWRDDQLAVGADGNGACLQCHDRGPERAAPHRDVADVARAFQARDLSSHTHHRAESSGSVCYNCHMPYTTYGLLKTIRSHQISSPSVQETLETGRMNACNLCHLDRTLAWTAAALTDWYGTPAPTLAGDDASVAASLVTLLKGDAGQRAIVAQSMGWAAAQQASDANWMAPYLALLLDDPYDAVRYIASRSLATLPAFETFRFDFVAPPQTRAAQRVRALQTWRDARGRTPQRTDAELLFKGDGTFNAPLIDRLMRERNNRRIVYRE
jgi:formate-dependent nitrite reductase cytochrome c552 subunit